MKATKQRATIRDVADRAQVSISTVSHVVNGTRRVEDSTRSKILDAIAALEYRPNQLARGLRGGPTASLGLIISDIREEFFSVLTKTIESAAYERGYTVILCDSEEDVEKEALYLGILADKGVDGFILAPVNSSVPPRFPRGRGLPVVQVDRRVPSSGLDFAGIDNRASVQELVGHLNSLGMRNIGFIGHEPGIWTMGERAEGFRQAMGALGLAGRASSLTTSSREGDMKATIGAWLAAHPGLEALVCGNANICFAAMEAFEARGGRPPRDLAFATFDDLPAFRLLRMPVTTLRQPTEEMGLLALDMLMDRMGEGREAPPREVLLPARVLAQGTGAVMVEATAVAVERS